MASARAYITAASVQQTAACHMSTVIDVSCIASSGGTACAVNPLNPEPNKHEKRSSMASQTQTAVYWVAVKELKLPYYGYSK